VGIARVAREAYPDPTAKEGDWSCVDLEPEKKLAQPVSLETIKADQAFKSMALVRNSRISVSPVTPGEYSRILKLAEG